MSLATNSDSNTLAQRLQSAEKSIAFIQREHAATLANLHEEISKWQQKCSDLTFQLAIGGGTVIHSIDENKLRSSNEQLEKELHECKDTIKNLNQILHEKEKLILDFENRVLVNERKHALELRLESDKQRQLKAELEERSTLIAQLTNQLYRQKQQQHQPPMRPQMGPMILPDRPKKSKQVQSSEKPRPSNRSSSSSSQTSSVEQDLNRVLFIGRRPPTPPQQLRPISSKTSESNEKTVFTRRQLQLLNYPSESNPVRAPMKLSPVLPPILNRKVQLPPLTTAGQCQQEGEV